MVEVEIKVRNGESDPLDGLYRATIHDGPKSYELAVGVAGRDWTVTEFARVLIAEAFRIGQEFSLMAEMQITYEIKLSDEQTLAYVIVDNTEVGRDALDKTLDLVGQAAARQKAKYDLPFQERQLLQCRETLVATRKRRAQAAATLEAHVTQMSLKRSSNVQPLQSDVNAVAEFDKTITNLEAAIKANELLIPRLKAIIAGETPPSLLTEAEPEEFAVPVPMAAE